MPTMIAFLRLLLLLSVVTGALLFAGAHRTPVDFIFSPFHDPVILPLYILGLGLLAGGFIMGMLAAWLGMHSVRRALRQSQKALKSLQKEHELIKHKSISSQSTDISAQMPPLPSHAIVSSVPSLPRDLS
ncbi:MAG: LapA family protein [Alphaproteobacteria bacterium]|nr:LapA family protein [Alphaproteobacteria bacterium]